jgi:Protein of unknown function (DUF3775)
MPTERSAPAGERPGEDEGPSFSVHLNMVCFIILKARQFDAKDVVTDPDEGPNAGDDSMVSVLGDHPDDPVLEGLTTVISDLAEDEQIDLVALAWLGRDDNTIDDWPTLRQEAARAHVNQREHTANYLLGMPLLGDYLEEGLAQLGLRAASRVQRRRRRCDFRNE